MDRDRDSITRPQRHLCYLSVPPDHGLRGPCLQENAMSSILMPQPKHLWSTGLAILSRGTSCKHTNKNWVPPWCQCLSQSWTPGQRQQKIWSGSRQYTSCTYQGGKMTVWKDACHFLWLGQILCGNNNYTSHQQSQYWQLPCFQQPVQGRGLLSRKGLLDQFSFLLKL